jgi:polar amino acid transport system permease protein
MQGGLSHMTAATDPIVAEIAAADSRRRLSFRVTFILTWVVLLGAFIIWLLTLPENSLTGRKPFDPAFILEKLPFLLAGVPMTIMVSIASIVFAVLLALIGALGRLSPSAIIYGVASLYVSVVRGTPLIVQILFVFWAIPQIIPELSRVPAPVMGVVALAFNYGAYMTEIFRAGIQAVPSGQREAAMALGMSDRRIMIRIVLPQAVRIVTPAIGNEFIAMIKDSALVSWIGVQELLWRARIEGSANFRSLEMYLTAALIYWILTMVLSLAQDRLEKRMARGDR